MQSQQWLRIALRLVLIVIVGWLLASDITIAEVSPILGVCAIYGIITQTIEDVIAAFTEEDEEEDEE
jgi:hypothetical protein